MQDILFALTVDNVIMLTTLGFKLAQTRRQARRLEVAIGEANASITE
jgi:hypothetical protein